jgi:predicted regulator of Ras-like GTPase activity (Roadblock/LC7/MglB family)
MLGVIKKLFSRKTAESADASAISLSLEHQGRGNIEEFKAAGGSDSSAKIEPMTEGNSLRVSLKSLVPSFPKELQGKNLSISSDLYVTLPKVLLLQQLSQGAVRIPFLLVRKAAPAGLFPNTGDLDAKLIDLPLKEVIKGLGAAAFARRPDQKALDAPAEIADVFGGKGQPAAAMRIIPKQEAQALGKADAPASKHDTSAALAFAPAPGAAPAPAAPSIPAPVPALSIPAPAPAPAPEPVRIQAPSLPKPPTAAPAAVAVPAPAGPEHLILELGSLCANWPEPLRREITRLELTKSKCHLPTSEIQDALKQGRVNYTWKQVHTRLKPAAPSSMTAAHDETLLELPIAVVASAFFAQSQAAKARPAQQPAKAPLADVNVFQQQGAIPHAPQPAPAAPVPPPPPPRVAAPVPPPAPQPAAPIRMSAPAAPVATQPAPLPVAPPSGGPVVPVKVSEISGKWPDALRKEIDHLEIGSREIEFPAEALQSGLKSGKVEYFWKQLCTWIPNCPPPALASSFADTRLEVPLAIVAPIFLKHKPSAKPKAATLEHIPDVFGPGGQVSAPPPEPEPAPEPVFRAAPQPVATPAPAPLAAAPSVAPVVDAPPVKPGAKNLAELFGEPNKRNWTPNEIVHRTTLLPGVGGALIALQDGLLVANCMPPTAKTETIAAFLPQIFGRLGQYAKELGMGELQSVSVTVEQGTLQVYKAGIIYFAVMGKPDSPLPVPSLNLIATELSRHTK